MNEKLLHNARDLEPELTWLWEVIDVRLKLHFGQKSDIKSIYDIQPPKLAGSSSMYASFIDHYHIDFNERLLLLLALTPPIRPALLDVFLPQKKTGPGPGAASGIGGATEFGGLIGMKHGGFLPTAETFVFLVCGDDLEQKFSASTLFDPDHFFFKHNILRMEPAPDGEPFLSGALTISRDIIDQLTSGTVHKPDLSINFPARRLQTELDWAALVLHATVLEQIEEIKIWLKHENTLMQEWGMSRKFRRGFRCLFAGPSGTGKTMTATLLGKYAKRDVYRIDLSLVISKYIGETEKNLSRIFDKAENKRWILFFDEADALFGKRTRVSDAHDRYANQEVSYLLQRIEEHNGIVLLASNLKSNMDEAFTRRFEAIIHFPVPGPEEREKIWAKGFPEKARFSKEIDLARLSADHEMAGGAIMNVIRYSSLMAVNSGTGVISLNDINEGIRKELEKERRTL